MIFLDVFYLGSINPWEGSPNWFDWLGIFASLVGAGIGAWVGWRIAEKTFSQQLDIIRKNNEDNYEVFLLHLKKLNSLLIQQKVHIDDYKNNGFNSLEVVVGVSTDFLNHIDLKALYNYPNSGKGDLKEKLTELIVLLNGISNFTRLLTSEVIRYKQERNLILKKFHINELNNHLYFNLLNSRGEFSREEGKGKGVKFQKDDEFMSNYLKIRDGFTNSFIVSDSNGTLNRNNRILKFDNVSNISVKQFIKPLLVISKKYIPEDSGAILVNQLANESLVAYSNHIKNMRSHIKFINSCKLTIIKIDESISEFVL